MPSSLFLRRFTYSFLGALTFGVACLCDPAAAEEAPVLRLGLSTVAMPAMRDPLEDVTLEAFERAFGRERLVVRTYPVLELEKAIRSGELDLFLGSAGLTRRVADTGARPLVTSVRPGLEDPNRNEGSLFVVRKDAPIQRIRDMRGRSLAANLSYGFSGYHAALGEIAAQGYDPSDFFSSSLFFGKSDAMPDIARAVKNGLADVGILRLCAFEGLRENGSKERSLPPFLSRQNGKNTFRNSFVPLPSSRGYGARPQPNPRQTYMCAPPLRKAIRERLLYLHRHNNGHTTHRKYSLFEFYIACRKKKTQCPN